jgi:hypothetical protein
VCSSGLLHFILPFYDPSACITDRPETRLGPPIPISPSPFNRIHCLASRRALLRLLQLQLYFPAYKAPTAVQSPLHPTSRIADHTSRNARLNPTAPVPTAMLSLTALALLGLRLVAAQNGTSSASATDIADVEANFQGELGATPCGGSGGVGRGVMKETEGLLKLSRGKKDDGGAEVRGRGMRGFCRSNKGTTWITRSSSADTTRRTARARAAPHVQPRGDARPHLQRPVRVDRPEPHAGW